MNYSIEMGSGAITYVPRFIKINSGIQKLTGGYAYRQTHMYTHRQDGDLTSLLSFFQKRKED
jgi:hypothetical protein